VKSIFKAMEKLEPNPDFVLWTGDSAPHIESPAPDYPYITNVTSWVFKEIKRRFNGEVPVVAALGNHDSYLFDSYPDQKNSTGQPQDSQYYKYFHQGGFSSSVVGEADQKTFLRCGYYTKRINAKSATMKFIVLNTNLYYNNKVNFTVPDPCNQLNWLNQTLQAAASDEKVFLVGHVPPGGDG